MEDESVTCEEPVQLGKDVTIVHNASGPKTLRKNKTPTGTSTAQVDSTVTCNSIEARDAMEDRWSGVNVIHSKSGAIALLSVCSSECRLCRAFKMCCKEVIRPQESTP